MGKRQPIAGGPHAEYAAEVTGAIARSTGARVEIGYILGPDADESVREDAEDVLASAAEAVGEHEKIDRQLLAGDDIVETIVEHSGEHDLTIVEATRESLLQQLVFGAIPEEVARRAESTVIMAKRSLLITSWLSRWIRSARR